MNYLRKAFNLYQMTHRVDASTTDIKALDNNDDVEEEAGSKKATDSTRSAATKARAKDMFARNNCDLGVNIWGEVGLLYSLVSSGKAQPFSMSDCCNAILMLN